MTNTNNRIPFIAQQLNAIEALERSVLPALLSDLSGSDGTRSGPAHYIRVTAPGAGNGLPALCYAFESVEAFHNATMRWLSLQSVRRAGIKPGTLLALLSRYTVATHRNTVLQYVATGTALDVKPVLPSKLDAMRAEAEQEAKKAAKKAARNGTETTGVKPGKKDAKKESKKDTKQPKADTKPVDVKPKLQLTSHAWAGIYKTLRRSVATQIGAIASLPEDEVNKIATAIHSVGLNKGNVNEREVRGLFDILGRTEPPVLTIAVTGSSASDYDVKISVDVGRTNGYKMAKRHSTYSGKLSGPWCSRLLGALMVTYNMQRSDIVQCATKGYAAPTKAPATPAVEKVAQPATETAPQPVKPASIADAAQRALKSQAAAAPKKKSSRQPTVQPRADVK